MISLDFLSMDKSREKYSVYNSTSSESMTPDVCEPRSVGLKGILVRGFNDSGGLEKLTEGVDLISLSLSLSTTMSLKKNSNGP